MSRIKIAPNDSGTGIFTIESPNSNTNRTITLPDNAGNFLTTGSAGAVVQVAHSVNSTTVSTGTSTSTDITFHSQTITPTSSSNKIFAICSCYTERAGGNDGQFAWINLFRDSTEIVQNWGNAMNYRHTNNSRSHATLNHLDSPSTTSQVTYRVSADLTNSGGTQFYLYRCFITLMEIVA